MNTKKNGVKTANFVVIRETKVPATLIELGFITSSIDIAKITSSAYQKKAADAIYEAVSELYKKYPVD
jgi:N-acetylmuramoyl-L-alanine amidase